MLKGGTNFTSENHMPKTVFFGDARNLNDFVSKNSYHGGCEVCR